MKTSIPKRPIKNPAARFACLTLSTALGAGYAPIAPGTVGSLLGIPLGLWLLQMPMWANFLFFVVAIILTAPIVERACHHWGQMDSGRVVWDEVLGQAIGILGLRAALVNQGGYMLPEWHSVVLAFLFFRIFDIFKPFPARAFDRKETGMGVILDDVVAGLYTALVMWSLVKIKWL